MSLKAQHGRWKKVTCYIGFVSDYWLVNSGEEKVFSACGDLRQFKVISFGLDNLLRYGIGSFFPGS